MRRIAGWAFLSAAAVTLVFQLCLAFGVPWGEFALGGAFPGQLPPSMRVVSAVNGLVMAAIASVVAQSAGFISIPRWKTNGLVLWLVVGFSALALLLNLITPSAGERIVWAPVAAVMLVSSAYLAWTHSRR